MVVILAEAVVAEVAVGCSHGPEDVARLAEFELEHVGGVGQVPLQVEDSSISTDISILVSKAIFRFDSDPVASRQNAWINSGCSDHEKISDEEEDPLCTDEHFPYYASLPVELLKKQASQTR